MHIVVVVGHVVVAENVVVVASIDFGFDVVFVQDRPAVHRLV